MKKNSAARKAKSGRKGPGSDEEGSASASPSATSSSEAKDPPDSPGLDSADDSGPRADPPLPVAATPVEIAVIAAILLTREKDYSASRACTRAIRLVEEASRQLSGPSGISRHPTSPVGRDGQSIRLGGYWTNTSLIRSAVTQRLNRLYEDGSIVSAKRNPGPRYTNMPFPISLDELRALEGPELTIAAANKRVEKLFGKSGESATVKKEGASEAQFLEILKDSRWKNLLAAVIEECRAVETSPLSAITIELDQPLEEDDF